VTIEATTERRTAGLPVRLDAVRVEFPGAGGPLVALQDLTLDIPAGSFTAIIGPNGCGKSTLAPSPPLTPATGEVRSAGRRPLAGDGRVACLQQPRLLPWLDLDNAARSDAARRAGGRGTAPCAGSADRVGLGDAASLLPAHLSGGMAQRAGPPEPLTTRRSCSSTSRSARSTR
jgi:ABC-type nitrate/sulfonate/bicarbonate transport system ATPase subunit